MADDWKNAPVVEGWESAEIVEPTTTKSEAAFNNLRTIHNPAQEAALSIGSKMVAPIPAGIANIAGMIGGLVPGGESPAEKGMRYYNATQDALTIDATNPAAQELEGDVGGIMHGAVKGARAIPAAMASFELEDDLSAARQFNQEFGPTDAERAEKFNRIVDEGVGPSMGEATLDATGSPGLATAASILPEGLAMVAGTKNPFRGKPKAEAIPEIKPEAATTKMDVNGSAVSVGSPSMDAPVDFTPPVPAETIVKNLRANKPKKVAEAVVPDVEVINSAQRLGVDLNPEHYSTNAAFQDVARALKTQPGSALQAKEVAALKELSGQADALIVKHKGTLDKSDFSAEIGAEIGTKIDDLSKQANQAYTKIREAIPAQTKVNTALIMDYVDQKLADFGGDKSQLSKIDKQLLSLVKRNKDGVPIAPTYAALDNIRKNVGAGYQRQGPFKDGISGNLDEAYSVLSNVQSGVARSFGIGDLYDSARGLVSSRKSLEDTAVQLFGRNMSGSLVPKIRGAATGLAKGDVSKFNQFIHSLPEARRSEAAATVLGDIFSGGSRQGGELGTGFAVSYKSLNRNKAAKDVLFSHLGPDARKRFDDIGRVLTGIIESNRKPLGNPSGTAGGIIKALDDLSFVEKLYEGGKKIAAAEGASSAIGVPGIGSSVAIGSMISKQRKPIIVAADEMIASPAFTRAVNKAAEGDVSTANQIIENSQGFKQWSSHLDKQDAANLAKIGFIAWMTEDQE